MRFRYLILIIHKDGEIEEDVNHKRRVGWIKWRSASRVLFDRRIPITLMQKFSKTVIRLAMLYSTEFWVVKKQNVHKMSVVDRIRNEEIY